MFKILPYIVVLIISTQLTFASDKPPRENPDKPRDYSSCLASTLSICMTAISYYPDYGVKITAGLVGFGAMGDGTGKCKCLPRPVLIGSNGHTYQPKSICTLISEHLCGHWGIGTSCCFYEGNAFECSGGGGGQ